MARPEWSSRSHADVSGLKNPRARWVKMSEEQAREAFEDYKKSHQNGIQWSKARYGTNSIAQLVKVWESYFPHEYEDFVELKMDQKTPAYQIGRKFEWRVKRHYLELGYWVLRSPQSRSPADLVALRKGDVRLLQCKVGGLMSQQDREELFSLADSIGARAFFVQRGRAPGYELIEEELLADTARKRASHKRR